MSRGPRHHDESRPHFVYRCYDADGVLLYVGCSVNPTARVEQHRATAWWGDRIASVRNLVFPTRRDALARERDAIYTERPRCNVKNRWYSQDPRRDWTEWDYLHFELALRNGADLIHGDRSRALVDAVVAERHNRFGAKSVAA